ncbi:hypothetical protein H5410_002540 [Solanum commersonii]|uniref:Uncharacterized protein n=1 Tax=Solanum commersonii TaxID=4109 RepID=A0A9J6B347_SOLCO|nr:hypothetical protein H5410_002540 [Solanum commersonii]
MSFSIVASCRSQGWFSPANAFDVTRPDRKERRAEARGRQKDKRITEPFLLAAGSRSEQSRQKMERREGEGLGCGLEERRKE